MSCFHDRAKEPWRTDHVRVENRRDRSHRWPGAPMLCPAIRRSCSRQKRARISSRLGACKEFLLAQNDASLCPAQQQTRPSLSPLHSSFPHSPVRKWRARASDALPRKDGQRRTDEVASIIDGKPCHLQRIERAGDIAGEFQQMLQSLCFNNQRTEPARLEVLLDVSGERAEKDRELIVVLRGDVWLQPDLQNSENLLLQIQRQRAGMGRASCWRGASADACTAPCWACGAPASAA